MNEPPLLLFDCDGVLVDSELTAHLILQEMLGESGVTLSLQETLDRFMGTSTQRFLADLATLLGGQVPTGFLRRFQDRTFAAFRTDLKAVDGALELIASLAIPFCVASNGPREKMQLTLGRTGLLPLFAGRLFSADDVVRPKPAPDLFLHAAQSLGASPADCVVIEDSPTGIAAGLAAGMRVLGFAPMGQAARLRAAGAVVVFDRLLDLPLLLPKMRRPV